MELFVLFWIVCWIATIIISSKKGEGCIAVITGFLAIVGTGNKIKCPFCQELIEKKAIICPHCRSEMVNDKSQTYENLKKQIRKGQL